MKNTLVVVTVILLLAGAFRWHDFNLIRANRWNSPSNMRSWLQALDSMTSSPEVSYSHLGLRVPSHQLLAQADRSVSES